MEPRIVASGTEEEEAILAKKRGADLFELRIDLCGKGGEIGKEIEKIGKAGIPLILTNRIAREGGKWEGSEKERIRTLLDNLGKASLVDVELSAIDRNLIREAKRRGVEVILSYHNFTHTPPSNKLVSITEKMFARGADIAKLAVFPKKVEDVIRLLELTSMNKPVAVISMGSLGRPSRVIAPLFGSVLTYGYVKRQTAPGQIEVGELKNFIRNLSSFLHMHTGRGA
jgi:3-dehydroquinate dehydratase-1